jgi:hypothetical protein
MSGISTGMIIHLLHIFIIGGLFLYVGLKRDTIPPLLFPVLVGLGSIILVYHLYKAYLRIARSVTPWVNLIHIFGVAPLLIFIGYNQDKTPRYMYELLLMFGFASIGYHGLYILEDSGITFM